MSNNHGWEPVAGVQSVGGGFAWVPVVDERHRCGCERYPCQRPATQEDLRCDECRETCRGGAS